MTGLGLLFAAFILALIAPAASQTRKAVANIGTLSCKASPPAPQSANEARLSCRFHATSASEAVFEGTVRRTANEAVGEGKLVLIWTVLAARMDVPAKALTGTSV